MRLSQISWAPWSEVMDRVGQAEGRVNHTLRSEPIRRLRPADTAGVRIEILGGFGLIERILCRSC
jgi:hypothetical protein